MSPKKLEGWVGDGGGLPLDAIAATVKKVADGTTVATGATDAAGHWQFTGLPSADEYFVTLVDAGGRAVVRGPWSGELREVAVRDRLDATGPLSLQRYEAVGNGQRLNIQRARGTMAAPTIVGTDDPLGGIYFEGWDGSAFQTAAMIRGGIDSLSPGVGDMPGKLRFYTTPNGSSVPLERMSISSTGVVTLLNGLVVSGGATTIQGSLLFTGLVSMTHIPTALELGVAGVANTMVIDFHSSVNLTSYDSRIAASGGSPTAGMGTLTFTAASAVFTGALAVPSLQVAGNDISYPTLDTRYVNASGDAMTGALAVPSLTVAGNAISYPALDARYPLRTDTDPYPGYVSASGDTMTGALALPANGLNVGTGQLQVSGGNVVASGSALFDGGEFTVRGSAEVATFLVQSAFEAAAGNEVLFYKARGTGISAPAIVNASDVIGNFRFRGHDGVGYQNAALIRVVVNGTPGAGSMPGQLEFWTTPTGTTAVAQRLVIDATGLATFLGNVRVNGNIGFYNTAAQAKQTISGSRGGNAALGDLLSKLATLGLITNSSSA